jgi:hypothetical protein
VQQDTCKNELCLETSITCSTRRQTTVSIEPAQPRSAWKIFTDVDGLLSGPAELALVLGKRMKIAHEGCHYSRMALVAWQRLARGNLPPHHSSLSLTSQQRHSLSCSLCCVSLSLV